MTDEGSSMMQQLAAGIDIGTNTILMTIAAPSGPGLTVVEEFHAVARLGEGLDASGTISPEALSRARVILASYSERLRAGGVTKVRAVATSAVRDARNRESVVAALSSALRHPVEVISGNDEAKLTFAGTVDSEDRTTVIDIGGGSTEITTGERRQPISSHSFDVGVVRLSERFFQSLPPSPQEIEAAKECILNTIQHSVGSADNPGRVVGVGGTPVTIALLNKNASSYDEALVSNTPLSIDEIRSCTSWLLSRTVDELLATKIIPPGRADVLPMGALILLTALEALQTDTLHISVRGLRYGALLSALNSL